ncbi:MAG: MDR family MFS transporter [Candidatus Elarobacter sp.]
MWMASLDSTVTNLGFATIAGGLNVSIDEVAWISTSYVLALAIALPLSGWLAANVGRKRAFMLAIAVFTVASLACALSTTLLALTLARFVQGFAAGVMQPLGGAALMDAYPREQLPKAFVLIGMAGMVGPLAGPIVGGFVLSNTTWPAIFLINLPIGAATLWLASRVLRDPVERGRRSAFDWWSLSLLAAGLTAMQYVVQQGPREDWFASSSVVAASVGAVVMLGWFVWIQVKAAIPLVDLRPLRVPSFSMGLTLAVVTGIGITGTSFIVPLYFEQILGFDALTAGLGVAPTALAMVVGVRLAEPLNQRFGAIPVALLGLGCVGAGTLWLGFLGNRVGFSEILLPRLLQGIGNGLTYVPLNVILMRHVPPRLYDAASGLTGLSRQLGITLGYAMLSGFLVRAQTAAVSGFTARVRLGTVGSERALEPIRAYLLAHGHSAAEANAFAVPVFAQLVERNAALQGYNTTFFVIGMMFVLTMPVIAMFWRRAARPSDAL